MGDKPTEKPRGTVTHDEELKAMAAIDKVLTALDDATRDRVVAWVIDRYRSNGVPS